MPKDAARTARGPMAVVAIDQADPRPLHRDELAHRMLPTGLRLLVRLVRPRPLRRLMTAGVERGMPGGWASFLCRKRYVTDALLRAADEGVDALVLLGGGFDTLAYRLPLLAGTPVFEVDLPENIAAKRRRLLRIFGAVPGNVHLVPIDFATQHLDEVLAASHFRSGGRTFFVAEAVTQYLTEDAVRSTFEFLEHAGPGSRLVFTHVLRDFLDGTALHGAHALHRDVVVKRRLWHFGLAPEQVAGFLAEYGWREVEQAGPREFTERYLRPSGREMPVSEIERCVLAEKV
ncbi:SAM-dependent methyltransferase [Salinifilum ghardaiensis]